VFVHGFSGSGGQYETAARRFASNGYPPSSVDVLEYDSTFATITMNGVFAALDTRIAGLLARTGADRVDLVGHSLGTAVSQGYLRSSAARAAKVAHYVNLDGATATSQPGGVPTLAIWGEGDPKRTITGATNVSFPNQSHTQTVTSPESFAAQYAFFTGHRPRTTAVVPQPPGRVLLSGRAVLFPSNAGVTNATLSVYRVNARSGARIGRHPVAEFPLSGDGSFGPLRASGSASYEFAISRPGAPVHHLYFAPFRRTDRLVRLLTSEPGSGLDALTTTGPNHTSLVVSRNQEWWGDQGAAGDLLSIDGTNVLNAATAPRSKRVIGVFAFDAKADKNSDLRAPLAAFFGIPFITGVDLYVPASDPPTRTVRLVMVPRGGDGAKEVIAVPAWSSDKHRVSVQFDDYLPGSGLTRR
jgi:hypothetical protein